MNLIGSYFDSDVEPPGNCLPKRKFILQTQCFLPCDLSFGEGIYTVISVMFIYNVFWGMNDDEWLNLV